MSKELIKIIKITGKRQITIPSEYYNMLQFKDNYAECLYRNSEIIIRPKENSDSYFAENILKELIEEGYSGQELLNKFKAINRKIPIAINKLIKSSEENVKNKLKNGYVDETNNIFNGG